MIAGISMLSAQTISFTGTLFNPSNRSIAYYNYPIIITGIGGFSYTDTLYTDYWSSFQDVIMGNSPQAGIKATITDCNGAVRSDSVFAGNSKTLNLHECLPKPNNIKADFSYTINGLSVTFIDQSTPDGPYWPLIEWDWYTGERKWPSRHDSIKMNVYPDDSSGYTHTYKHPGLYEVNLDVYDNSFDVDDARSQTIDLVPTTPATICGLWEYGGVIDPIDTAIFYLITHDATAGILTAIDTTYSVPTGYYEFSNLPDGTYYLKAAPLPSDPDYAKKIPVYYSSFPFKTRWQDALPLDVTNAAHIRKDFQFTMGTNPGGPGFIGGLISQGANKGPGDPIEGVSILLFNSQDKPVTHTTTDANGEYSFSNIAYGAYKVHVEVIGKTSTDQLVTISAGVPSVTEIDFEVNSKTVDLATGIDEVTFGTVLQLYPNPTADDLFVELELKAHTSLMISVIDQLGRELKAETHVLGSGEQQVSLSLEELPVGIYLVRLATEGEAITRRVVKW